MEEGGCGSLVMRAPRRCRHNLCRHREEEVQKGLLLHWAGGAGAQAERNYSAHAEADEETCGAGWVCAGQRRHFGCWSYC